MRPASFRGAVGVTFLLWLVGVLLLGLLVFGLLQPVARALRVIAS